MVIAKVKKYHERHRVLREKLSTEHHWRLYTVGSSEIYAYMFSSGPKTEIFFARSAQRVNSLKIRTSGYVFSVCEIWGKEKFGERGEIPDWRFYPLLMIDEVVVSYVPNYVVPAHIILNPERMYRGIEGRPHLGTRFRPLVFRVEKALSRRE